MLERFAAVALGGALLAAAPTRPAPPAGAFGTVRQQVRRAKPELAGHTSLPDWHESPFQPSEIVERIHALESGQAWAELCRELAALPDDELELFEDAIRKPEHARRMPCAGALLARVAAYWKASERKLSAAHPTRTPRVLEILAAAHVKAMFFEIGRNAAAHPDVARSVLSAGHTVGSHTFSHPNMARIDERHAESEVESGDASVSLALGFKPGDLPFFRFPYGAKTPLEQGFVSRRGNTTVFWNMDSQDWKIRDPHRLFLNVLSELDRAKHGIILFHDIHEQTVIVLPHVLAELQARRMKTVVFVAAPTATSAGPAGAR